VSNPPRLRSQVFSTSQRFPSRPEFGGLVSCRNRPGLPSPSESSPREESRTSLEAAGSLAVIHRRAETHPRSPCHRRFRQTPTPRRARLPASPDDYEVPFVTPKRPSRSLWTSAGVSRPVATPSPASKLSSSSRVRSRRFELPRSRRPILSWTSTPLKSSLPAPRDLDPPAPGRKRAPQPCERLRAATEDLAALAPGGRILWVQAPSNDSVGSFRLPSEPAWATSRWPPSSHGLTWRAYPPR